MRIRNKLVDVLIDFKSLRSITVLILELNLNLANLGVTLGYCNPLGLGSLSMFASVSFFASFLGSLLKSFFTNVDVYVEVLLVRRI
jgi:hypothetical protein